MYRRKLASERKNQCPERSCFDCFSAFQLCIRELWESYCEKRQKEHLLNKNEQINECNLLFPATHTAISLAHSHANKTVQKTCLIKFRLHSCSVLMPRSSTDGCSVTQPGHHWTGRELQHCLFAQPYYLSGELLTENLFWIQRPLNIWNYLVIPELVPRSVIWIMMFDKGLWRLHLVLISNLVILILPQCDQIQTDKADNGWW